VAADRSRADQRFRRHPAVREALAGYSDDVRAGRVAASVAARRLLELAREDPSQ